MATQAELEALLTGVATQLSKASGEIVAKIGDLEVAIANAGNTTPEVDAAVANLKTIAQALDDIVPDTP